MVYSSLSSEDIPEEEIPRESSRFLFSVYHQLGVALTTPLAPDEECLLRLSRCYVHRVITFVGYDFRYRPDNPVKIDAIGIFSAENGMLAKHVENIASFVGPISALGERLRVVQLAAGVFFDYLEGVFELKEVRKCRIAFNALMQSLGTPDARGAATNYLRRHKTMARAIVAWRANGGDLGRTASDRQMAAMAARLDEMRVALEANTAAVEDSAKKVEGFGRRLGRFLEKIEKIVKAFTKLFRPGRTASPPRELVGKVLLEGDRLSRLDNVKEPHRSEIIEVVRLTKERPIVLKGLKESDWTLANAARVVWDRRHLDWEKVAGAFETYGQLKASCYHLQQTKDRDPFFYK